MALQRLSEVEMMIRWVLRRSPRRGEGEEATGIGEIARVHNPEKKLKYNQKQGYRFYISPLIKSKGNCKRTRPTVLDNKIKEFWHKMP